jgi:PAS domain S-box-containing protein
VIVVGAAEPLIQASLLGEALDNGPAAVFVADDDMHYIAVNETACKALGYTRDELLSLPVTDIATYPEAADEFADIVAHGHGLGRARLRRKDGGMVAFEYRAGRTTIAGMTFYVFVGWPVADGAGG